MDKKFRVFATCDIGEAIDVLRKRGYEATLVALFYAVIAWIVMHVAITIASDNHPNYHDPVVIIGGVMSHLFFTVPLALVVKRQLAE